MSDKLKQAQQQVSIALANLAETVFTPDAKLTFVMRVPGFPERYMVISDDADLDEVAATVIRSKSRPEVPNLV